MNTDSKNLVEGEIHSIGSKDNPFTATKFLCTHAVNALHRRNHLVFWALLNKAKDMIQGEKDRQHYAAVEERLLGEIEYYPDQRVIEAVRPSVLQMIRNNPGILQSELKKRFPVDTSYAHELAYAGLYKDGIIQRQKAGRSFRLYVRSA